MLSTDPKTKKDYEELIDFLEGDIEYYKSAKQKMIRERDIAAAQVDMYENMIMRQERVLTQYRSVYGPKFGETNHANN